MENTHRRVVIVGGGITGLAAACRLQRLAAGAASLHLFEAEPRLGGKIRTERESGCTLELGPDIFLARKPRGIGLCRELGLADRIRPTNPDVRGSYIQRRGRLYPLPEGLSGMIPTRLGPLLRSPLLSLSGKLRLAADLFLPAGRGADDESIGHFITRRLGREVFDALVDPLLGGIYGGSGDQLSLEATFPQLRALERRHGSLIRGLLATQRRTPSAGGSAFVTLADGMETLITTLAKHLERATLHTGEAVTALEARPPGYVVHTPTQSLMADAVVVTTPAFAAADLLASISPPLAEALAAIAYGSTATISLGYRAADVAHPLDAYGYIIPASEGKPVLACTWTSTKIPGRAAEGTVLLRLFLGRSGREAVLSAPDETLVDHALKEVRATLGITAPPLFVRLHRWRQAMPQYRVGHPARLAHINALLASLPGLFLAGAAYRGVGIPDCIHDGEQAAEHAWRFLHATALTAPS